MGSTLERGPFVLNVVVALFYGRLVGGCARAIRTFCLTGSGVILEQMRESREGAEKLD